MKKGYFKAECDCCGAFGVLCRERTYIAKGSWNICQICEKIGMGNIFLHGKADDPEWTYYLQMAKSQAIVTRLLVNRINGIGFFVFGIWVMVLIILLAVLGVC